MKLKYSKIDFDRRKRIGMIEAVWGENKSLEQISEILKSFIEERELALVTRLDIKKAEKLTSSFANANYHQESRCLTLGTPPQINKSLGDVIVLSGGTSDLYVAAEAQLALRFHGVNTDLLLDVGVAGLHRLLNNLERIKKARVLIACAGMEGSLPTILAGLTPQPVIGVPVSVGYGVSAGGKAALDGMLASCSPGLLVMNIDNGYGAAMAALRILNSFKQ